MSKVLNVLIYTGLFIVLTLGTQTGGIVLLVCIPLFILINRKANYKRISIFYKLIIFIAVYSFTSATIVPLLAARVGRVPLPAGIFTEGALQPLTVLTCLLNRQYVRPELKQALTSVASALQQKYPGSITCYLDANFPFLNGFPLVPHLSHNDGRKADLAFFYQEPVTGKKLHAVSPSWIGYGVSEPPLPGEMNMPAVCEKKGYWQYGILNKIMPQGNKRTMVLDTERTKSLITLLVDHISIQKLFIEPHLIERMQLRKYKEIRFHGCQAVRHDDHIHVQL